MTSFLAEEKVRQAHFKASAPYFSVAARARGVYKHHAYEHCLPIECAKENLFPGIRESIIDYFDKYGVKWHDGGPRWPSNHLCDSQVCCANFLFPFADKPQALAALLSPYFPTLDRVLPIENGQYIAFEWIGDCNYLHEHIHHNHKRTRGANFTSADAALMFQHRDGRRQMVLIEWKYTETYSATNLEVAGSGAKRTDIYRWLYEAPDCPLDKYLLPSFEDLFYEPFYQFMRQQFLAHEMEKYHEREADIVSLFHIAPAHNGGFRHVTSPQLQRARLAESATAVWSRLTADTGRFRSVSTEELFGHGDFSGAAGLAAWYKYVGERYAWIHEPTPELHEPSGEMVVL